MVSKAKLKYIKSLQIKKFRRENGEFLVEGAKSVLELLRSDFFVSTLLITPGFRLKFERELKEFDGEVLELNPGELTSISSFENNDSVIAVAGIKENKALTITDQEFVLVLDDIKDPGNLGTIIRIADWYGIKKLICSKETAEFYNPKVISASMGSFTRVSLFYTDLVEYLSKQTMPILAATLDGTNLSVLEKPRQGFILMGNESKGIHEELLPLVTQKITIPRIGNAESLNVSVATGIICDRLLNR